MSNEQKSAWPEPADAVETAVLTTHGGEEGFRSSPVAVARVGADGDLWLLASRESAKAHQIEMDGRVQIVCQNGWIGGLCYSARAVLNHDCAKIQELWKPDYEAWFPSADMVVLIHVFPAGGERGENWNHSGLNRFLYLYPADEAAPSRHLQPQGARSALAGFNRNSSTWMV